MKPAAIPAQLPLHEQETQALPITQILNAAALAAETHRQPNAPMPAMAPTERIGELVQSSQGEKTLAMPSPQHFAQVRRIAAAALLLSGVCLLAEALLAPALGGLRVALCLVNIACGVVLYLSAHPQRRVGRERARWAAAIVVLLLAGGLALVGAGYGDPSRTENQEPRIIRTAQHNEGAHSARLTPRQPLHPHILSQAPTASKRQIESAPCAPPLCLARVMQSARASGALADVIGGAARGSGALPAPAFAAARACAQPAQWGCAPSVPGSAATRFSQSG